MNDNQIEKEYYQLIVFGYIHKYEIKFAQNNDNNNNNNKNN